MWLLFWSYYFLSNPKSLRSSSRLCVSASWTSTHSHIPVIISRHVAAHQNDHPTSADAPHVPARSPSVRRPQPPSARCGTGAESIMRPDVASCGLIMSKCLRGQMREYRCWRVRRAPLPPRQRALSTPIRVPPPRRAVAALRCVVAALLSQHGGPSADLHTARGPQDGPPPLLRQREAAAGRRHGRGPGAASRLETKWGGGRGGFVSAGLGSVQLGAGSVSFPARAPAPLSLALSSLKVFPLLLHSLIGRGTSIRAPNGGDLLG